MNPLVVIFQILIMPIGSSDEIIRCMWKEPFQEEIKERDRRKKRAVTSLPERRWNNAVIPYEISDNFTATQRSIFNQASDSECHLKQFMFFLSEHFFMFFYRESD